VLTKEENERLVRVGPGTPMGTLFRRFWLPVLLEEQLPGPDCPPVEVRILGEDLVAFRDSNDDIALIGAYCPHRGARLSFGRNEERGLRCVYHGWKFDTTGRCVDMPSEPPTSTFKNRVTIPAYPGRAQGGVIWAYFGPPDRQPADLPGLEWAHVAAEQRIVSKRLQFTNWLQALEGGIDSSHVSFLHKTMNPDVGNASLERLEHQSLLAYDTAPRFTVKEAPQGLLIGARRNTEDGRAYWRITQCLMPAYTMIPPVSFGTAELSGHAWVPIDDENVWVFTITWNPERPITPEERARALNGLGVHSRVDEDYVPLANIRNRYLQDHELQRTGNFTGIRGISEQDLAVQELQGGGRIFDRSTEHLGTSDLAIIAYRRLMGRLVADLAAGKEPAMATNSAAYRVRSASVVLDPDVAFDQGARSQLVTTAAS
jgi:phthalate 4,5-dioxygenase oxygenase subunit